MVAAGLVKYSVQARFLARDSKCFAGVRDRGVRGQCRGRQTSAVCGQTRAFGPTGPLSRGPQDQTQCVARFHHSRPGRKWGAFTSTHEAFRAGFRRVNGECDDRDPSDSGSLASLWLALPPRQLSAPPRRQPRSADRIAVQCEPPHRTPSRGYLLPQSLQTWLTTKGLLPRTLRPT